MAFELVPGLRHLSLPWLWLLTGRASEPCRVAVGTGTHSGLAAVCPENGRGYVVAGTLGGGLGGLVDLGGGFGAASIMGLYNGEPVVTDGGRYLFKSARWGWCVSGSLAEPSEWEETSNAYAVVDGTAQLDSTSTQTLGSTFWTGTPPSALGTSATFSPRGDQKDSGSPVSVCFKADLARRVQSGWTTPKGISGEYETYSGDAPPDIESIGEFAPTGETAYVYQAARLL